MIEKENSKLKENEERATALVSMKKEEKTDYTKKAKMHGLTLSNFFRLAANEYIENHNW